MSLTDGAFSYNSLYNNLMDEGTTLVFDLPFSAEVVQQALAQREQGGSTQWLLPALVTTEAVTCSLTIPFPLQYTNEALNQAVVSVPGTRITATWDTDIWRVRYEYWIVITRLATLASTHNLARSA